jgi:hypothetical protein
MEKVLITWLEDQTQKCKPFSTIMITAKAKHLSTVLKEKACPSTVLDVLLPLVV